MSGIYKTALDKIPFKALTNKCIVLDLDETLVHSNENLSELNSLGLMRDPQLIDLRNRVYELSMDDVVYKKGQGLKTEMWGITRPHVKEFLISCFAYFKVVAVWSAGKKKYVESIVDYLFKDIRRPHIVYSREKCETLNDSNKTLTKPLMKMINSEPGLDRYMSLENTFIIDDRKTVFEVPNPNNGIQIPPYEPKFNIRSLRTDDIALKQLMTWLLKPEVMNSSDVRLLNKENIFDMSVTVNDFNEDEDEEIPIDYNIFRHSNSNYIANNSNSKISRLKPAFLTDGSEQIEEII